MRYPYKPLRVPAELARQINGRLDKNLLARTKAGGLMWKDAAVKFNRLYDAAKTAGFTLRNIGDYRSYDDQVAMFMDRYEPAKPNDKRLKKKGTVTRQYHGKTWILKKGKSPSAAPDPTGKNGSNHGWGLAIDLAVEGKKGEIIGLGSHRKAMRWMCENAPKYGFYLQGSDPKSPEFEAWHWQFCGA